MAYPWSFLKGLHYKDLHSSTFHTLMVEPICGETSSLGKEQRDNPRERREIETRKSQHLPSMTCQLLYKVQADSYLTMLQY